MHGLYLLWWVEERQLSPAVVAAVLAAGDLALVGLELPTGWFADRVGHRRSLILGSAAQVAGILWFWIGHTVVDLVNASLLVALGDAFRSGADQALLYRTCVAAGCERDFQRIEARTHAVELVALMALLLAGGAIVSRWGFHAGWAAETALAVVGLALAWAMAEPPPAAGQAQASAPMSGPAAHAFWRRWLPLILPAGLLAGAAGAASFLAQTTGALGPAAVTQIVAAITLAEALGALAATRLHAGGVAQQLALGSSGTLLAALALVWPAAAPAAVLGLSFLTGLAEPLRDVAIQRLAADHLRARAASIASACDMVCSTLLLPLAGLWRARQPRRGR